MGIKILTSQKQQFYSFKTTNRIYVSINPIFFDTFYRYVETIDLSFVLLFGLLTIPTPTHCQFDNLEESINALKFQPV